MGAHVSLQMGATDHNLTTPTQQPTGSQIVISGTLEAYGLRSRERQILQLLLDGLTIRQIAGRLEVSFHTVDTHIRNIYSKLHVHNRGGAVAKSIGAT